MAISLDDDHLDRFITFYYLEKIKLINRLQKLLMLLCMCPLLTFAQTAQETQKIIKDFYDAYNAGKIINLAALIDDDHFVHQINYEKIPGKDKFLQYIADNKKNYAEPIDHYILMTSTDGHYATTQFTLHGKYLHTDDSAIPAHGQQYTLAVMNFFEIENNKIVKASVWFDEKDWEKQVNQ